MSTRLVSVEQAAEHLSLHPKTVLRYIREGRLPASRVGKSYRIVRSDLDAFVGATGSQSAAVLVRTTCIVDIAPIGLEEAERLAAFLQSAALARSGEGPPLQLQTAFDRVAGTMKVVVIGDPSSVAQMLEILQVQMEARR